jgi:predicted nucleic acid-binding protein
MMILLDTTALVGLTRLRDRQLFRDLLASKHLLATSVINVGELYAGMRSAEAVATEHLLSKLECYAVTMTIARRAGLLKRDWARQGRTLKLPDMIVAATALEHGLTLMTSNRKDFPMPELKFYPPDAS